MRPLRSVRVRHFTAVLAAVGAGALLAGCASSATPAASSAADPSSSTPATSAPATSNPATSAPSTPDPSGDGTSEMVNGLVYVSTSVTGQELVADSEVVIQLLPDSRISVNAGCNTMNGTVTDNGDSWEVGPLMMTQMGCEQALADQDTWVAALLEAGPAVTRDGGEITLTAGEVSLTLVERMPAGITDTAWELTGLISKDAITSVPIPAEGAMLTITDGRLELAGICNGTGGEVTIAGDTLTVELGPSTLMSCGEEVDAAEQQARAVLGGTSTWTVTDQELRIMKDDGTGLQFVAAGPNLPDDMETFPTVTDAPESFPESPMTSNG